MGQTNEYETITADLEKLRALIKANTSDERFEQVRLIIGSIVERLHCAIYHYEEYKRIKDKKRNVKEHFDSILGDDSEYYWEKISMTANVLAFMQSLHVFHDILAHLISYALQIEFKKERNISLNNVYIRIKDKAEFTSIVNLLNELREHDDFKYISANVNHSKHKYSIGPSKYIDFRKEPVVTCSFSSFVI